MHGNKFRYKIIIEGESDNMGKAQAGPFLVTVQPAAVTDTIVFEPPSGSLPAEQEGVPVTGDLVTTVSGSNPPFSLSAPTGVPDGMQLNELPANADGSIPVTISGTPSSGDATGGDGAGNYEIGFTVTDSANPPATARFGQTRKLAR